MHYLSKLLQKLFKNNLAEPLDTLVQNTEITHRIKRYEQRETGLGINLLCEGYRLDGNFTLTEIHQYLCELRSKHPQDILLATLDDVYQSAYTCYHSQDTHDLDSVISYDPSHLPATAFEDHQGDTKHIGYLSLTEEFPIRYSNFMKKASQANITSLTASLPWKMKGHDKSIVTDDDIKNFPREKISFIQIVPVRTSPEAIAAYPNGYFVDDLNPFQNYILSKQMLDGFGFNLFGIGATYLGFMRDTLITKGEADQLGLFLAGIYYGYENNEPLDNIISKQLIGKSEFYIAYALREEP